MATDPVGLCIGCVVNPDGGDAASLWVAAAGVLISLISAAVSVAAVRGSSKNHDALILREEFQPHRAIVDAALEILDEKREALELSVSPSLPISRLISNFNHEETDTQGAAMDVLRQAQIIDERAFFRAKWDATLRPIYRRIEQNWDCIDRANHPDGLRRLAATEVVADLKAFRATALQLLDEGIKAPLARKKWST
jgi:hypothetical protein